MNIKRFALLTVLSALLIASFQIGCDELTTEVIETTEAGHPIADFGLQNPSTGMCCAPCTVTFKDSSVGPRQIYTWYFGDGDSLRDTLPEDPTDYVPPTHVYETAGIYNVSLRIRDTTLADATDLEMKDRYLYIGLTGAAFAAEPLSGCPGDEFSFSPLEYSDEISYLWTFGDGTGASTESNPKHVYEDTGTFWAILNATDNCGTGIDSVQIFIGQCPNVRFFTPDTMGCTPYDVTFFNYTDLFGKEFVSRSWDFGDGSSADTSRDPVHTYSTPGTYTVSLRVTTEDGTSTTDSVDLVRVADMTIAAFTVDGATEFCYSATQQFKVNFVNQSVGAFDSSVWRFGDGFIEKATNPIHAYVTPGIYSCTLETYGPCGADTTIAESLITLADQLFDDSIFIAIDTVSGGGTPGSEFTFRDTSKVEVITTWSWVINSTPVSSGPTPTFDTSFADAGTYAIKLTVSNECGVAQDSIDLVVPIP